jgi:putative flippase GtrA
VSTAVHFSVLFLTVSVLRWPSVGLSNLAAAAVGIVVSYLGNRYFVFRSGGTKVPAQLSKFVVLYACLAVFHGMFLFLWSDLGRWDYRVGFVIAVVVQAVVGYWGNRNIVFKTRPEKGVSA